MLIIKAKNKETNAIHQFTPSEWYEQQKTGEYIYYATINISEPSTQPIQQRTVAPKRGCGCANKRK